MSSKRRAFALLSALLLLGAAFAAPAGLAQDDEDDEEQEEAEQERDDEEAEDEGEEDEREEERSIELEIDGKDVKIELERETEPREDEVEMRWKAEEATFELAYESENETQETEDELEAVFGALAEYRDENDNGRYDAGEEIVSGWALGDEFEDEDEIGLEDRAEWDNPSIDDVSRDGKDGKRITTTAQLGGSGELTLRFLVFGDFVDLNGTSLSPTGAKIDIVVEDYGYQANGTDLALFLETETKREFEQDVDDDDDETGVSARDPGNETAPRLVFTWKDQAEIDGQMRDVATTVLEEETETESDDEEAEHETERSFVLSYPRGEEIVHDPRAEVLLASGAQADVPAPGIAALLGSIAAIALAGRRPDP